MDIYNKLYSVITTVTVAAMFFVITIIAPFIKSFDYPYFDFVLAFLLSMGSYKLLNLLILELVEKLECVKKYFLGPSYLNGTWLGEFEAEVRGEIEKIITVEHYEQSLKKLDIRGYAYFEKDSKLYAQWESDAVTINPINASVSYKYSCPSIGRKEVIQGICVFNFIRENERSYPFKLIGYSADLVDGKRTPNTETRISEKLLDPSIVLREKEHYLNAQQ